MRCNSAKNIIYLSLLLLRTSTITRVQIAFPCGVSHYTWVIVGVIVGARQQLPDYRSGLSANDSHYTRVIVGVIVAHDQAGILNPLRVVKVQGVEAHASRVVPPTCRKHCPWRMGANAHAVPSPQRFVVQGRARSEIPNQGATPATSTRISIADDA